MGVNRTTKEPLVKDVDENKLGLRLVAVNVYVVY